MPAFTHPPSLAPSLVDFISRFYEVSDKPDAVDEYLSFLTDDVDFVMGLNAVQGSSGSSLPPVPSPSLLPAELTVRLEGATRSRPQDQGEHVGRRLDPRAPSRGRVLERGRVRTHGPRDGAPP